MLHLVLLIGLAASPAGSSTEAPRSAAVEESKISAEIPETGAFSHADWGEVLQRFVDEEGRVDYRGLARDRGVFDRYLAAIRSRGPRATPDEFPTRDHELAYLLNAYNALTFEGVLDRGPENGSVWGLTGTGVQFFGMRKVRFDGETTSLKRLEDERIRAAFGDPRIHAALNCASAGCPRLPRQPFEGNRLDEQLDAVMREMALDPRHVRVDYPGGAIWLSKIFDWFRGDFEAVDPQGRTGDEALLAYLDGFRGPEHMLPRGMRIRFPSYDKSLNAQGE